MVDNDKDDLNRSFLLEFKSYKNSLEHIKKVTNDLLERTDKEGIEQNFSCNSEIIELAERIKFSSYRMYVMQNFLIKGEK